MPRRQRDYAAEYAARKAKGAAAGKSAQAATGHARREATNIFKRTGDRGALLRVEASQRARKLARSIDVPATGQRITNTASRAGFIADVRRAARAGDHVAVQVTFANQRGEWKTRRLTSHGLGNLDAGADSPEYTVPPSEGGGLAARSKVRATYGPPSTFSGDDHVPASDVLDALDDYDDVWDLLYDWWLAEYEEL